jgi:hypothetical protein
MTPMAGPTPGSGGLRRAEIALRYLLLTGVVVGVAGHWPGPSSAARSARPRTCSSPPEAETSRVRHALIGHSVAVAAGVTLAVLEVAGSHHAPAAATALLVATGLAKPGGLVLELAIS